MVARCFFYARLGGGLAGVVVRFFEGVQSPPRPLRV